MLILFILSLTESKCPKYECKSSSQDFDPDVCIYYKNTTGNYYTRKCPSGSENSYCNVTVNASSYCIPPPKVLHYPGESCKTNEDCISLKCNTTEKCEGEAYLGNCTSNQDCNVGLYCEPGDITGHCVYQSDETCTSDYDCKNNHGCNNTGENTVGKCVKYFDIEDYAYVGTCQNNRNLLCNTGHCLLYKGHNRCFGPAVNKKAPPYYCDSDHCKSHKDENLGHSYLTTPCSCGYNSEQKRVCQLFNQDSKSTKYFRMLKDWYESEHIKKCHTSLRNNSRCMKEHWGDYDEFMYRYYKSTQYHLHYYAKDCVLKVAMREWYHFNDIWSSSLQILVGLSLFSLV